MEYTTVSIIERLGKLVNRIQRIRETIPVEMERGDARHVALSGIQTSLCPLMLAFGALEVANQHIGNIELSRLCGLKKQSNDSLLAFFDTWAKLNILVFSQFRFESLVSDLLAALDSTYNQRNGFHKKVDDLLIRINLPDRHKKKDCFRIMALLRNSLHNNSINKNGDHTILLSGVTFNFENDKPTHATIQDTLLVIEQAVEIAAEIVSRPEILALPAPIENSFQIEIGQFGYERPGT